MKNVFDLLIVGNGYDLASEYETSYEQFLRYCKNTGCRNMLYYFFDSAYSNGLIENDEWNSFEKILCQYLQFLDYIFTSKDVIKHFSDPDFDMYGDPIYKYFLFEIPDISKIPNSFLNILHLINPLLDSISLCSDSNFLRPYHWSPGLIDSGPIFGKVYVNARPINKNFDYVETLLINKLDNILTLFEEELKKYIAFQTKGKNNSPFSLAGTQTKRIVSFNYSKTAQNNYGLSDDYVAYIHGNIDSKIILGIEPSMIKDQSIDENSRFILFFKRFRRIYKDCNKRYNEKIVKQLNNESVIGIYGHSLDLSDKSILKPLFEAKFKNYIIFCYKTIDAYKIKLVNLIGLDLFDELDKDNKIIFSLVK